MSHPNRSRIKNWPEHLRAFRKSHKISQKKLADLLEIAASKVEKWENGIDKPPPYLKKALLKIEQDL